MPLDARGHGITASLDDDVVDVEYDLERAIAMYLLAQGASPRTWDSITSSSGDPGPGCSSGGAERAGRDG